MLSFQEKRVQSNHFLSKGQVSDFAIQIKNKKSAGVWEGHYQQRRCWRSGDVSVLANRRALSRKIILKKKTKKSKNPLFVSPLFFFFSWFAFQPENIFFRVVSCGTLRRSTWKVSPPAGAETAPLNKTSHTKNHAREFLAPKLPLYATHQIFDGFSSIFHRTKIRESKNWKQNWLN